MGSGMCMHPVCVHGGVCAQPAVLCLWVCLHTRGIILGIVCTYMCLSVLVHACMCVHVHAPIPLYVGMCMCVCACLFTSRPLL